MKILYKNAVYTQVMPFHNAERDWNNDGDIYIENVSVFELIEDSKPRETFTFIPRKLVLSKYNFADMVADGEITIL